jgi:NDP-sugar pyrophosphorylase family protein
MSVQGVDRVVVATDDDRIRHACEAFGAEVVMTFEDCENGTERCAEAFATFGGGFDVVVNLQGDAPSNLAVIGRYILSPKIMQNLNRIEKDAGGEIQLTDAIAKEMEEGRDVFGYCFEGKRYDCGSKVGYLQAMVAFALEREDLRDEFGAFLDEIVALRNAPE